MLSVYAVNRTCCFHRSCFHIQNKLYYYNPLLQANQRLAITQPDFKTTMDTFTSKWPSFLNRYHAFYFLREAKMVFDTSDICGILPLLHRYTEDRSSDRI